MHGNKNVKSNRLSNILVRGAKMSLFNIRLYLSMSSLRSTINGLSVVSVLLDGLSLLLLPPPLRVRRLLLPPLDVAGLFVAVVVDRDRSINMPEAVPILPRLCLPLDSGAVLGRFLDCRLAEAVCFLGCFCVAMIFLLRDREAPFELLSVSASLPPTDILRWRPCTA